MSVCLVPLQNIEYISRFLAKKRFGSETSSLEWSPAKAAQSGDPEKRGPVSFAQYQAKAVGVEIGPQQGDQNMIRFKEPDHALVGSLLGHAPDSWPGEPAGALSSPGRISRSTPATCLRGPGSRSAIRATRRARDARRFPPCHR